MPERYLHLIAQIFQTFTEQKFPVVSGFFVYLFIKASGFFSITILGDSSAIMHFLAAMIEYILGLLSALSVTVISAVAAFYVKKYLERKHANK